MKTVWVIEQGSYSDYRVIGIYSSRKNAQIVCDAINAGDPCDTAEIAEWPVDQSVLEICRGYHSFYIIMLRDGTVEHISAASSVTGANLSSKLALWKRTEAPVYKGQGIPDALNGSVVAKDAKHAIKIANERRTQMIALGEWP